jgi:hypothetical protein
MERPQTALRRRPNGNAFFIARACRPCRSGLERIVFLVSTTFAYLENLDADFYWVANVEICAHALGGASVQR